MRSTLVRVGIFVIIGACLLVLNSWWRPNTDQHGTIALSMERIKHEEQRWQERWGRAPSEAERAAIVRTEADEEILFREAMRAGLHRRDPIVMMRLVQNMGFVQGAQGIRGDEEFSPEKLLQQAYKLGMHESDIVVRRRLVQVLHHRMLEAANPEEPSPSEIHAYIETNADRFEQPPAVSFGHVYINVKRKGWSENDAKRLLKKLQSEQLPLTKAIKLGDPIPMARHFNYATTHEITKRFGPELGPALLKASPGSWSGPYTSKLGEHLILMEALRPATLVFDQRTLNQARLAIIRQRKTAMVDEALADLRDKYETQIVSTQQTAGV